MREAEEKKKRAELDGAMADKKNKANDEAELAGGTTLHNLVV
jgi:hypothetical protein